ncbi:tubulin-specific chaperone D, partial [Tachysurus ichikawai]
MELQDVEGGDDGAAESELMSSTNVLSGFTESSDIRALISSLVELQEDVTAQETTIQRFMGEELRHLLYLLYQLCPCPT